MEKEIATIERAFVKSAGDIETSLGNILKKIEEKQEREKRINREMPTDWLSTALHRRDDQTISKMLSSLTALLNRPVTDICESAPSATSIEGHLLLLVVVGNIII